jgi:hypothetical protein
MSSSKSAQISSWGMSIGVTKALAFLEGKTDLTDCFSLSDFSSEHSF